MARSAPKRPSPSSRSRDSFTPAATAMSRPLSAATAVIRAVLPRFETSPGDLPERIELASERRHQDRAFADSDDFVRAAPVESEGHARPPSALAEKTARRRVPGESAATGSTGAAMPRWRKAAATCSRFQAR